MTWAPFNVFMWTMSLTCVLEVKVNIILRATPTAAGPYDVLQAEIWKTCKTSRKADQDTSAAAVISSLKLTYRIKQLRYCRSPQGRQHRICFIRQVAFKDEITAAAFLYSPPRGFKNYVFTRGKCCRFFLCCVFG